MEEGETANGAHHWYILGARKGSSFIETKALHCDLKYKERNQAFYVGWASPDLTAHTGLNDETLALLEKTNCILGRRLHKYQGMNRADSHPPCKP